LTSSGRDGHACGVNSCLQHTLAPAPKPLFAPCLTPLGGTQASLAAPPNHERRVQLHVVLRARTTASTFGGTTLRVDCYYLAAMGAGLVLLLALLRMSDTTLHVTSDWWLSVWSTDRAPALCGVSIGPSTRPFTYPTACTMPFCAWLATAALFPSALAYRFSPSLSEDQLGAAVGELATTGWHTLLAEKPITSGLVRREAILEIGAVT
jgi:hypothetical protein